MYNNAKEYYESSKRKANDPDLMDELEDESMEDYEKGIAEESPKKSKIKAWGEKEVSIQPLKDFSEKYKKQKKAKREKKLGELKEKRTTQKETAKIRLEALKEKKEIGKLKGDIRKAKYDSIVSPIKSAGKEVRRVHSGMVSMAQTARRTKEESEHIGRGEDFFSMGSGKGGAIDWDAKKSDSGLSLTIGRDKGKGEGMSVLGGGGKFGLAVGGNKGTGGSVLGGGGLSLFAREPVRKRKKASKSSKPKSKHKPRKSGTKSRKPSKKRKSRTKKRRKRK